MSFADDLAVAHRAGRLAYRRSKACLARPSQNFRDANIQATKEVIDQLIEAAEQQQEKSKPPSNSSFQSAYTAKGSHHQHTLEITQQQNDPLEPLRHRFRKELPFEEGNLVLATPETKAPIMRAPPAKLSAVEKEQWKIPSSISNWKNERGYMIDLNARSAASVPLKASNDEKNEELGRALMEAEQDLKRERNEEEAKMRRQSELRKKLLEQKGRRRAREEEHDFEEVFDSRLFQVGSKARQAPYDEPMFGRKVHQRKPRSSLEFQQ